MVLLSGTSNLPLSRAIAKYLGTSLGSLEYIRFRDQEIYVEIKETIRGKDVFFIQSTSNPANDYIMETLITIDALRRGSAKRITLVMPYFGYARQDRKTAPRSPITAKLIANIFTSAGVDRMLAFDLHSNQLQGFFDIPLDHMQANVLFVKDIKAKFPNKENLTIVSPDFGGVTRARQIAKYIGAEIAVIDKRRPRAGVSEVMNIIGDVNGKDCIMIDDIADSCGTLCNAAKALVEKGGAKDIYSYVTHGIFSENAIDKINESYIKKVICTDSIHNPNLEKTDKISYLSCSELLGEAIKRVSEETSTSDLFLK